MTSHMTQESQPSRGISTQQGAYMDGQSSRSLQTAKRSRITIIGETLVQQSFTNSTTRSFPCKQH